MLFGAVPFSVVTPARILAAALADAMIAEMASAGDMLLLARLVPARRMVDFLVRSRHIPTLPYASGNKKAPVW
jgi:hypothetical protein